MTISSSHQFSDGLCSESLTAESSPPQVVRSRFCHSRSPLPLSESARQCLRNSRSDSYRSKIMIMIGWCDVEYSMGCGCNYNGCMVQDILHENENYVVRDDEAHELDAGVM
ncbi:uncharacterized protein BJ212DRAFT_557819 [Suillus subaureus]|uniref:Uncharacterized protein n=1 Tax=Suillus subaureus TaxID=48587 RepID=A0A9P7JAL9_9AGAM|nr:uncharacterized protein BJ212DRAFT_557819 [Suillus subaureus]KAG1811159.1 hypothetical protein BJ212DRAFT_557819 [Suillus subaureus]